MRVFQISLVLLTIVGAGWCLTRGKFKTTRRRSVLRHLGAADSKGDENLGEMLAKVPEDVIAKMGEVSSTVSDTINEIQATPRKVADEIDDTVNSVTKTIEDTKKTANDVYNAPGYYFNAAQMKINNLKQRAALIEEKGAAGLVTPLDEGERNARANLSVEERAALNREELKRNVAAALDITEQVVLLGIEGVKKTPDAIEKAKQLVEVAKTIPSKVDEMKVKAENLPKEIEAKKEESAKRAEEAQNKVAEFQVGLSDTVNTFLKWVTLEEPKRLANKAIETVSSTKAGVKALAEDVKSDVEGIVEVASSIPGAFEATKETVNAFPSKVELAIKEVQTDIDVATERVTSFPSKLGQKKKEVIENVGRTKSSVMQAAEEVSNLANSAGAAINSANDSIMKKSKKREPSRTTLGTLFGYEKKSDKK